MCWYGEERRIPTGRTVDLAVYRSKQGTFQSFRLDYGPNARTRGCRLASLLYLRVCL